MVERVTVAPRDAACFTIPAGHFFRICSVEGPQVGDLNLFNEHDLNERFYSGKTRALNGTHVGLGDQLFSSFPWLRPMATITHDTLGWYGFDEHGGSVHDVIIPAAGWSDGMVPRRADKRSAIRHGWKASGRPCQSSKSAG